MRKILVAGGSGMVGTAIKNISKEYDHEFIFLSSKDCDLRDRNSTLELFSRIKPDYVICLSAIVGGLFANMRDKVEFLRDNLRMNENVLEACHLNNIQRGIFCLSTCIFPAEPSKFPMTIEDLHSAPPHESNFSYAMAKRMLEVECRNYNTQYGREYICVVPCNLYGENDNYNLEDSHIIPAIIHKTYLAKQNNTSLTVLGTGKPLRQFLYAGDFAEIIMFLLFNYKHTKPVICASDELSIKQVVEEIVLAMDFQGEIMFDTSRSDGIYKKTVCVKHLLEIMPDLKFTPFREGISKAVQWFINNYDKARK